MLHCRGVTVAHRSTAFASLNAGPELGAGQLEIRAREARDDACRGQADIRAIVAIANARYQLRHLLFTQASVGAGIACFSAGIAGRNALNVNRVVGGSIYRMRLEHLFDVAHKKSSDDTTQGSQPPSALRASKWFPTFCFLPPKRLPTETKLLRASRKSGIHHLQLLLPIVSWRETPAHN